MKILVTCQYYKPEPFRISDICEELASRGHEVTVVCGQPNYPMGEIYDGYSGRQKREEILNGVKVHRCFNFGRKRGMFHRTLNYLSYYRSSGRYAKKIKDEFDVVFVNQLSPVLMANAAIKYKKKHNKKIVLYCLDLWPESLVFGGIKRGSVLYRILHNISKRIYKNADEILITSKSFETYFKNEFGISCTHYLPQYAESMFSPESCSKIPDGKIDLMFAGNVGTAQSVETIIRAAEKTRNIPNLRWHIVGDGSEFGKIKSLAEELELTSVIFHGRQPIEKMPEFYSMADAMLVTMQANPIISMTLPGKVQSYMAAGKPIIGAINGETPKIIKEAGCGLCCDAEDSDALAKLAVEFMNSDGNVFGKNAYDYYCSFFKKHIFLDKLEATLSQNTLCKTQDQHN